MDRYAISVDVGYLFASAGAPCCGTSRRQQLSLDAEAFIQELVRICDERSEGEHRRTYWYDGAKDALPTQEQ